MGALTNAEQMETASDFDEQAPIGPHRRAEIGWLYPFVNPLGASDTFMKIILLENDNSPAR